MLHIDEAHSPVVVCTFDGPLTDDEVDAFMARLVAIGDRGATVVYVMDGTRGDWLTAEQRRRVQTVMTRRRPLSRSYCAGVALVASRSVPRVMLRAILTVSPLSVPVSVHARFDEAVSWANARIAERGLTPPRGPIPQRGPLSYPPARTG